MTNPTNQLPTPEEEEAWREMEKRAAIQKRDQIFNLAQQRGGEYAQEFMITPLR